MYTSTPMQFWNSGGMANGWKALAPGMSGQQAIPTSGVSLPTSASSGSNPMNPMMAMMAMQGLNGMQQGNPVMDANQQRMMAMQEMIQRAMANRQMMQPQSTPYPWMMQR